MRRGARVGLFALVALGTGALTWFWVLRRIELVDGPLGALYGLALPLYSAVAAMVSFAVLCLASLAVAPWWRPAPRAADRRRQQIGSGLAVALLLAGLVWLLPGAVGEWRARRAERASTPPEQLGRLLDGAVARRDRFVVVALVKNSETPAALLRRIAALDWPELRQPVFTLRDLLRRDFRPTLVVLARRDDLAADALERLARDPSPRVAGAAAAHASLPPAALYRLRETAPRLVLVGLARNHAAPTELLAELARHEDAGVRESVAANPRAPAASLAALAEDPEAGVRARVASHEETPTASLHRLAGDPAVEVRAQLAANPGTPAEVLEELAQDPSEGVRRAARYNLRSYPH